MDRAVDETLPLRLRSQRPTWLIHTVTRSQRLTWLIRTVMRQVRRLTSFTPRLGWFFSVPFYYNSLELAVYKGVATYFLLSSVVKTNSPATPTPRTLWSCLQSAGQPGKPPSRLLLPPCRDTRLPT